MVLIDHSYRLAIGPDLLNLSRVLAPIVR